MRKHLALAAALVIFFALAPNAALAATPCAIQPADAMGNYTGFGRNAPSSVIAGANFTISATCSVGDVGLKAEEQGSPSDATIGIYADSGGLPSGSALSSGTISAGSWNTSSFTWATSTNMSSYTLSAGTYWIEASQITLDTSNAYLWAEANVSTFANDLYWNGTAWIPANSPTWNFMWELDPAGTPPPPPPAPEASSTALWYSTTSCTTSGATTTCNTYEPSTTSPTIITYHDWLFMNGMILLCLWILTIGVFYSAFNIRRRI